VGVKEGGSGVCVGVPGVNIAVKVGVSMEMVWQLAVTSEFVVQAIGKIPITNANKKKTT
jgi:hypothetical protein